ncbi:hypothetical protein [Pseudomonas aeruginosa]|uniref:hypothetical protein n=1 Tax=Pseudomonas aeruginosa TaxID=287 RepID=UPI000935F468|nr:hypothetical protein [Pseudomonas aeruginosa]HCE6987348.1 hypothetical protein [Pseudomonas aeruginosa]
MKNWLQKTWQEAGDQAERDTADAMKLPWAQCSGVVGFLLAFLGTALGLLLTSIPGAIGGGIIGYALGLVICLPLRWVAWMLPTPFAWLARRLGYAR